MTIALVTGGIGYVGRELVRQLIEAGTAEVHVVDTLACGEHRLDSMETTRFTLHPADIRDPSAIAAVMDTVKPDIIYHLAAIHYIPLCETDPGNAIGVNVAGTVNLLDAAPKGVRFVFASTAAVYAPDENPHVERDEARGPIDIYGITKLQGEEYVRYYHSIGKIDGVIVRLFNVVGPGETNPHLVPAIIRQLSDGATDIQLGNLHPRRDYIDVADVARGFQVLGAVSSADEGPVICNLGTGRTHAVVDVVTLIATAAGIEIHVTQDAARMRAVDRPMLRASTDRLQHLTGWKPEVTLAQSMARAWDTRTEDRLT
jgi:UDP-glucose 4-epimerase